MTEQPELKTLVKENVNVNISGYYELILETNI